MPDNIKWWVCNQMRVQEVLHDVIQLNCGSVAWPLIHQVSSVFPVLYSRIGQGSMQYEWITWTVKGTLTGMVVSVFGDQDCQSFPNSKHRGKWIFSFIPFLYYCYLKVKIACELKRRKKWNSRFPYVSNRLPVEVVEELKSLPCVPYFWLLHVNYVSTCHLKMRNWVLTKYTIESGSLYKLNWFWKLLLNVFA